MANPTSKEKLLHELISIDSEKAKSALIKIFTNYLNPAFGALPKRENEIIMFQVLQDLNIFDKNPDLYSILSSLRVTRSKARNLLYESNLRKQVNLDEELLELLKEPILLKESDKIMLEIDNPLLIDHLKHTLKKLDHITDGSFSPDIVKITPEAYKTLLNEMFSGISKKQINQALIECGLNKRITVGNLLTGVLKKIGDNTAGEVGSEAAEKVGNYIGDLFLNRSEKAKDFIRKVDAKIELVLE